MGEPQWAGTEAALRAALDRGDLGGLVPLLGDGVTWHGSGPGGGCHSREDVVSFLAGLPDGFRLRWLRRVAGRVGLHVVDPAGNEACELMVLDDAGLIVAIRDHPDVASVESDLGAPPAGTGVTADALVPFVHVTDLEATVAFYALLGFEVVSEHRPDGRREWVWLRCGAEEGRHADLMLALGDDPVDPSAQGVLFYLYTDDLDGLRRQLRAHGHLPGAIADGSPRPRRELRVDDPTGYCLMIAERE